MFKYVAAFLFFCAAELCVLLLVGRALGALVVLGLLALGFIAGVVILNQRGAMNIIHFAFSLGKGQGLGRASGTLCWVAAAWLLMFPGFISDAMALLLFLPPVQGWLSRKVSGYVQARAGHFFGYVRQAEGEGEKDAPRAGEWLGEGRDGGQVFEAEVRDVTSGERDGRNGSGDAPSGR